MPTVKFKATKMKDAKVSHISLVERGANRIPFRVVKQENQDMSKSFSSLDLGNLGALFTRKTEAKPEIVGVVTMKGEGFESMKEQIEAAGFDVSNMVEAEDGSIVFKQAEFEGEGVVVRLSEHVALVTKGFSPYNMDVISDGVTFGEQCSARGFYPGVSTIMEVLGDSVRSAVYTAKSSSEASQMVSKMFKEAEAYASSFISGLPEKAFKLESLAPTVAAKEEAAEIPDGEGVEKGCNPKDKDHDGMSEEDKKKAKKDESGAAESSEGTEQAPGAEGTASSEEGQSNDSGEESAQKTEQKVLTEEDVSAIVGTEVQKSVSAVLEQLGGFAKSFESIQKSMQDFGTGLTELKGRMDEAEKVAKSAQAAVTGMVVTGSDTGDAAPTRKGESSEFVARDIDTAFMGRRSFPRR